MASTELSAASSAPADLDLSHSIHLAAKRLNDGVDAFDVELELRSQGMSPEQAERIVEKLVSLGVQAPPDASPSPLSGLMWLIGGIAVTAASGGHVIAWGAILFGGIQFLRGLATSAE